MARVDDYRQARDLAAAELAGEAPSALAARSGFALSSGSIFTIPFLTRIYNVSLPGFRFDDAADPAAEVPLQEQVLVLHYMQGCRPVLHQRWIAYREIPGAAFYFGAFLKRAVDPLKKTFGQNPAGFRKAAAALGGQPIAGMTSGFRIDVLPYAPLQVIIYEGDEEFPAEAAILFDAAGGTYLSPEDNAWLASLTVYRMMAMARSS